MADDIPNNVSNTVSGGGSTTTTHGAERIDTDASKSWQGKADRLKAEREQYRADFLAEGGSGKDLLRDSVYQDIGREQRDAELQAYNSQDVKTSWTETSHDINGNSVGQPTVTETYTESVNTQPDLTPSPNAPSVQQTEISNTRLDPSNVRRTASGEVNPNLSPKQQAEEQSQIYEEWYAENEEVADFQEDVVANNDAALDNIRAEYRADEDPALVGDEYTGSTGPQYEFTEGYDPNKEYYDDMGELVPADELALDDPRHPSNNLVEVQDPPVPEVYYNDMGEEISADELALDDPNHPDYVANTQAEPKTVTNGLDSFGCTSDEVYDDQKGYCVPKFDDFGCTPDEEWDDTAGYCVTKGEKPKQAPPSKPVPKDIYSARRAKANNKSINDWRVRLSLAPQAQYLYNKPGYAGILEPLRETDGIIFPYVPRIDTIYHATYNQYDLTHSNYRGYFYQNSYPGEMLINATFTAQDTKEANYMLAVIHFIRSCTKMFYGQDHGNPHRGSPPPLVFMRGLGEHQFNEHPCVVTLMNYNLPDDVDYIKASVGGSLGADTDPFRMNNETKPTGHQSWSSKISRLWQSGLEPGAAPNSVDDIKIGGGNTMSVRGRHRGDQGVSRVPTKLDISFNLLPIQTRDQVSNQYSMDKYGTGELLKRGFY